MPTDKLSFPEVQKALEPLGFQRMEQIAGTTFKDNSTVIIIPVRGLKNVRGEYVPVIHQRVVHSWQQMIAPMNQKRALLFCGGHEVGKAYDALVQQVLNDPQLSQWKYVLTLEDDNIVPPDTHIRLLESIEYGPYDAASGLYWTKGDINMPMAYGDPNEFRRTGVLNFRPLNVAQAVKNGNLVEVNGIAMGCALWRMDVFRRIAAPWFITLNDFNAERNTIACYTQDLQFCERMVRTGMRLVVDTRVKVGHIDVESGTIY